MGDAKHTPGPWHVEKPADELVSFGRHPLSYGTLPARCVLGAKPSVIVWANSAEGRGFFTEVALVAQDDEANAALIAAAPDLLAAVSAWSDAEDAAANCQEHEAHLAPETCPRCFPLIDAARVAMRAALVRARGEG